MSTTTNSTGFTKRAIKPRARRDLDLSDSGFAKAYDKELKPLEIKYNLKPEKWELFKQTLLDKCVRCCLGDILTVEDNNNVKRNVIKEFSLLTKGNLTDSRDFLWTDSNANSADKKYMQQNNRLKANLLGHFLLESLTESTRKIVNLDKNSWEVTNNGEQYYHGPIILWLIANEVKPDSGHLIDEIKKKLRTLNINDFGFCAITMLTEFVTLGTKILTLGGTYDDQERQLDFWNALKTMEEQTFKQFVRDQHNKYRTKTGTKRKSIVNLITLFKRKEINMRSNGEWNKLSAEQAQILALMSLLTAENQMARNKNHPRSKRDNPIDEEKDKSQETRKSEKRRQFAYESLQRQEPKEGEPITKEVDGKTYHW